MKKILQKLLVICAVIAATSAVFNFTTPNTVNAASECRYFLGMVSWDCNTGFTSGSQPDENAIKSGIWAIVANVATDITVIAAYLVLGYVIYGGYLYIFSAGDPNKVATGKKALTQAFIGLAIVLSANAILTAIRAALGADFTANCAAAGGNNCYNMNNAGKIITHALRWVIGISGAIALIFIVYGGIAYTTSGGDPSKLQKAKNIILYALIGLVIVALSELIVSFVAGIIDNANESAYYSQSLIAKESYEITSN